MSTYLITGATGFVGKRLINALMSEEHKVIRVSRNPIPNFETVICDFESSNLSKVHLRGVDIVFHLAGIAHDLSSISEDEGLYQKINLDATIELAELAVTSAVKKFVFVSSVKAGGRTELRNCMNELDQYEPEGIYGKTKREAELKLLEIGQKSEMHVSIVRPSLVYGPDVKGNLKLMMDGIKKGWFPPLPEVRNSRSMIHVDDLVQALLLVSNDIGANGEIFIATDGKSYSSRDLYEAMCYASGKSIPKWNIPIFLFEIAASLSSNMRDKVDKLFGDEYYSSEKLQSIGFKAQRTLREMNETAF